MELAKELGQQLHEVMGWEGPMTHRQYLAWRYWLAEDRNAVGKQEAYLMQIACEVRRVLHSSPSNVKISDFKLTFETGRHTPESEATPEEASRVSKLRWLGAFGYKGIRGLDLEQEFVD